MLPTLTSEELDLLRTYDTPTVCNVIELFDFRPRNTGFMDQRIQAAFPELPPMVGYAATATFRSAAPPAGEDLYLSIPKQVESFRQLSAPQVVVFQDLDDPPRAATFGEIMCATYQVFGCVGLITSGAGRDLAQVRDMRFPVFTSGSICSHGYCHILDVNIPVQVGGITVYPGDLLHGDRNGVTTIPREIAREVSSACGRFAAIEAELLRSVRSSGPDLRALLRARDQATARTQQLARHLRNQDRHPNSGAE